MLDALGRFSFAAGPLQFMRAFLGPLYAWASAGPKRSCRAMPMMILLTFHFLKDELMRSRHAVCKDVFYEKGEYFRVDAKAQGNEVCIGGWVSASGAKTSEAS